MLEERYEIIKLLGKGRTGGVYEAEDTNLGRKVAMRRFFAQTKQTDVSEYKEDFEKVAHSLSALQHPNLLRVYDAGVDNDGAYIISQLLTGETLHDRMKSDTISVWEVNDLAQQMLDALSTAHKEGFVHGAITPGSILLSPRARGGYLYVILDMGLSRMAPLIQGKDSVLSVMADPAILAPELFEGGVAEERADLYMLGHILYMCLAGGHPFAGVSLAEAEQKHQEGLPPLQDYNADVPEDFRLWIESLIQLNPEDRPASAVEALNSLPKVNQPAKAHTATVQSTAARLNTGTGAHLKAPAGNVTGPLSSLGGNKTLLQTGPLTSHVQTSAATTATSPVAGVAGASGVAATSLPVQKKSKTGLFIILGLVVAVGAILAAISLRVSSEDKKLEAKKADQTVSRVTDYADDEEDADAEEPVAEVGVEKQTIVDFDGSKPSHSGWKYDTKVQQKLTESKDGWLINGKVSKGLPGIKHSLKGSQRGMFDKGWKLTYKVRPLVGIHRLGFHVSRNVNPGWRGGQVSINFGIGYDKNNELFVSPLGLKGQPKKDKYFTFPSVGATGWHTITVEQKPKDSSGSYTVFVDGKEAFKDKFIGGKSFNKSWNDHLFSSTVYRGTECQWVVRELKLETQ